MIVSVVAAATSYITAHSLSARSELDIHQQIHRQQQYRIDHHDSKNQRLVSVENAIDEMRSQARDVEYFLDDE